MVKPVIVTLSADRARVHVARGNWSGHFPVEQLGKWIALYIGLRDRVHGRYAAVYAPVVEALQRVQGELRGLDLKGRA